VSKAKARTENGTQWVLEIADGFGNPLNYGARTLLTFKDRLYLGTATNIFEPGEGCEVWRTDRPCPDADGDGYAASWCMGPDTDDTDPQIVPELSMLKQRFRWQQDGSIYTPTW